jgi:hypothetical protein
MWANGRSSLVQVQHQPIRCQLNSSCGGRGWGRRGGEPLYVPTEKNAKIAEIHSITLRFGHHEDLVKTKLFIKDHEKNKNKAFYYNKKI